MNDAEIKLKVSVDGNEATSSLSKIGDVGKKIGAGVLKGAAVAGAALVGLVGKSVAMAGELEQQIGGTEAVFGKFADEIQQKAKNSYSTMGTSANDYMQTINKMGALMQGSGIEQEKAMDLSAAAMQRASDVASVMGISMEEAMYSIAGAAKGNFTMMDNLGVAMNATTIESYALSKGIKKTYQQMTKAEQIGLAMEMFLQNSAYASGNYAKENETLTGSLSTLKASFDNFMSGAGDIGPVIDSVVAFGEILVQKIIEMAPKILDGIVKLINGILPMLPILLEKLLPGVIEGVVGLAKGIVDALPIIISTLATMLPGLITALIEGLTTIVFSLADMLPELIPVIIDAVLTMIPILIDNLPLFIKTGYQLIIGILEGLINAVPTLLSHIPKIIKSMINYFKTMPSKMIEIGTNMVKGLWEGIKNVTDWLYGKIKGFVDGALSKIKSFFGIKSPSKEFAIIGRYNIEGLEEGMEEETKVLNRNIGDIFGSGLDIASKMGLNGNVDNASNLGNQHIVVENHNTLLLDGRTVYDNQQEIGQMKNLQTGFGG